MYGKIFQEIFHSTVADFNGDTIYTFMAMITLSDDDGYINYSVTALARTLRKDISIIEEAIKNLTAPDPESGTPDHDGRRIIPISELTNGENNRGWWVVNKCKYKALASREDRKDQNRASKQRQRKKEKSAGVSNGQHKSAMSAYTDTDTDTDTKDSTSRKLKFTDEDTATAVYIFRKIRDLNLDHKEPNLKKWGNDIRLMRERDGREVSEIRSLFDWANNDSFWQSNILCPATLRKQWDKLILKRKDKKTPSQSFDSRNYPAQ